MRAKLFRNEHKDLTKSTANCLPVAIPFIMPLGKWKQPSPVKKDENDVCTLLAPRKDENASDI